MGPSAFLLLLRADQRGNDAHFNVVIQAENVAFACIHAVMRRLPPVRQQSGFYRKTLPALGVRQILMRTVSRPSIPPEPDIPRLPRRSGESGTRVSGPSPAARTKNRNAARQPRFSETISSKVWLP